MLLAGFAFAAMNVLIKLIPTIPALEIVLFRSAISFVISFWAIKRARISTLGNNKSILLLRGIFGSIGLIAFFYTLQNMPLAAASVIHYTSPIFTGIIAMVLLKERMNTRQYVFFFISIIGVFTVYGFDLRVDLAGLSIGLLAALSSAAAYNCIRKLQLTENPNVIILYFPLVAVPVSTVLLLVLNNWVWPTGLDWLYLLLIGLLTQLAQYGMTVAYQNEKATKIAPISYVGIVYALTFGYFLFDETFDWEVLLGMFLVLIGVILNIFQSRFFLIKNEETSNYN
jgi:drug/metabolite transporter (DMT)-like permease